MEFYHEKIETDSKIPARIYYGGTNLDKLRYPLHWHHNLELDLVMEGCIKGKVNGNSVEVREGEIFFVNSGELHETDATACKVMRSITILLSDELLREYCPDIDSWTFFIEKGSSQQKQIAEYIKRCAELYSKKRPYYELHISIELRKICSVLLEECKQRKPVAGENACDWKTIRRVKAAIAYMEKNFDRALSLNVMAEVMGMTPSYFSRFFKRFAGKNFHSYLTWIRLCHAREQLTETDATVIELALSNGFPNVKAFIEAFKNEWGMTPTQYRKRYEMEKFNNN